MTRHEFIIAKFLIHKRKMGVPLPDRLPESLMSVSIGNQRKETREKIDIQSVPLLETLPHRRTINYVMRQLYYTRMVEELELDIPDLLGDQIDDESEQSFLSLDLPCLLDDESMLENVRRENRSKEQSLDLRRSILNEIIETEKSYVLDLETIIEVNVQS